MVAGYVQGFLQGKLHGEFFQNPNDDPKLHPETSCQRKTLDAFGPKTLTPQSLVVLNRNQTPLDAPEKAQPIPSLEGQRDLVSVPMVNSPYEPRSNTVFHLLTKSP